MVTVGQMGPFVREYRSPFAGIQATQHAGGHHDAPRMPRHRVGLLSGMVDDGQLPTGRRQRRGEAVGRKQRGQPPKPGTYEPDS